MNILLLCVGRSMFDLFMQSFKERIDHCYYISIFFSRWLREFLDEPYNGHQVLIDFLAFLLKHPPPTRLELERKKSSKSSKTDKSTSSTKRRRNVMARSHVSIIFVHTVLVLRGCHQQFPDRV